MAYLTFEKYGSIVELKEFYDYNEYEQAQRKHGRRRRQITSEAQMSLVSNAGQDPHENGKLKERREDSVRRSKVSIRKRVLANSEGNQRPIFVTLTYATSTVTLREGRAHFNAFAKRLRYRYGEQIKFVVVPEFTRAGRLHFHALFWGLPSGLSFTERITRVVARTWGRGFVDIRSTWGSPEKLASYISKYLSKRIPVGERLHIWSLNAEKILILRKPIFMWLYEEFNLSTAQLLQQRDYEVEFYGRIRHEVYRLNSS